ncbi:glycoside hydrolase family 51 protein [Neolentinus lepideus HHB14362 ss-1]|uniref:non-reducing end alpha-L-arabinofuranosidase n=1 Tax=Neolentinus lepideus HHB14362 ss-1 TaxID=1314782 RepID=A0A165QTG2_9AGAM|nr:glycoside hydrolase family 51 protein [Neolentinus lepideus HHB14362 ss-1]
MVPSRVENHSRPYILYVNIKSRDEDRGRQKEEPSSSSATMGRLNWLLYAASLTLHGAVQNCLAMTTVSISASASHPIPTTLFLQNRAFQQVTPNTSAALTAWHPIGSGSIAVIADSVPVSSALPNSLQLTIPAGASGTVGFGNEGYWGIKVDSTWMYNASFYYRFPTTSSYNGTATISLVSTTGDTFATALATLSGTQTTWQQVYVNLKPTASASDTNNNFTVTLDGTGATGETINFAMFSLFPPTYKNRANGMRVDIAETLAAMNPSFFRLPGGNNIGETTATRWQWNATIGPLVNRPGRQGDWGYINTDGLGLLEYLYWCEDVGMQPIMAVWAGYSLGGTSLPEDQLSAYIQQASDQVRLVWFTASSKSECKIRASLGRTQPFNLTYVEVGNEDFFASTSYVYRWKDFVTALSASYPHLQFIATTYPWNPVLTPTPKEYDNHVYQTPHWFASNSFYYDSYERNGTTYFEGEYAAISTNSSNLYGDPSEGRFLYPTMEGAAGEAAFMTGLERNSDIVFAASYAPLLQNIASSQWTPDLVSFDAGTVYKSTSYYVQQLFSVNRGNSYLPSTLPSASGSVFWSVTRQNSPSVILIKVANTVSTSSALVFQLPSGVSVSSTSGTLQVITGSQNATNSPANPNVVTPTTSTITVGSTINYNAPGYSVSVITVPVY